MDLDSRHGDNACPDAAAGRSPATHFHGFGRAGETGCGAAVAVLLRFSGSTIAEVDAAGRGSDEAEAAARMLAGAVEGGDWRQAAALPAVELAALMEKDYEAAPVPAPAAWELPGAAERRRSRSLVAAGFAIEALHRAFEDALRQGAFPTAGQVGENTVLVAMSGGVDSSVACLLEKERGKDVIGVTMRLWSDPQCTEDDGSGCCSPKAVRDARAVCHQLGVPHLTVDMAASFEAAVVGPFVSAYLMGLTPNPCTACNGGFRFPALVALADLTGAGRIATGHYARISGDSAGRHIARPLDREKDQSYMLWGIPPALLPRLEFPLAGLTKEMTRSAAREAGLPTHARPESQDICFIPDGDHRRFLRTQTRRLPGPGPIVNSAGRRLGVHSGYIDYTIGQRRGLGGGADEPLFVTAIRPADNIIVAGPRAELDTRHINMGDINLFIPVEDLLSSTALEVQVRYRSAGVPVRVTRLAGAHAELVAGEALAGVAPGQSAVIYRGEEIVAGGVIEPAFKH